MFLSSWLLALTIVAVVVFERARRQKDDLSGLIASVLVGVVIMAWAAAAFGLFRGGEEICREIGGRVVCDDGR